MYFDVNRHFRIIWILLCCSEHNYRIDLSSRNLIAARDQTKKCPVVKINSCCVFFLLLFLNFMLKFVLLLVVLCYCYCCCRRRSRRRRRRRCSCLHASQNNCAFVIVCVCKLSNYSNLSGVPWLLWARITVILENGNFFVFQLKLALGRFNPLQLIFEVSTVLFNDKQTFGNLSNGQPYIINVSSLTTGHSTSMQRRFIDQHQQSISISIAINIVIGYLF